MWELVVMAAESPGENESNNTNTSHTPYDLAIKALYLVVEKILESYSCKHFCAYHEEMFLGVSGSDVLVMVCSMTVNIIFTTIQSYFVIAPLFERQVTSL